MRCSPMNSWVCPFGSLRTVCASQTFCRSVAGMKRDGTTFWRLAAGDWHRGLATGELAGHGSCDSRLRRSSSCLFRPSAPTQINEFGECWKKLPLHSKVAVAGMEMMNRTGPAVEYVSDPVLRRPSKLLHQTGRLVHGLERSLRRRRITTSCLTLFGFLTFGSALLFS